MQIKNLTAEKAYHLFFETGIIAKGIFALGEIGLGILFYSVTLPMIGTGASRGFLLDYIVQTYHGFIGPNQSFWAFLFLTHGLVKAILIWALLKNKLWAYPASAVVFGFFAVYQIHKLFYTPTLFLELFTVFDIIVIVLVLHEYKHKKRSISAPLG